MRAVFSLAKNVLLIIGLLASSALGVAACGKKGDVKPPPSYQND